MDVDRGAATGPPADGEARLRAAERLLADWLVRRSGGGAASFEDLLAAHPGLRDPLLSLRATAEALESLAGSDDPGALLQRALGATCGGEGCDELVSGLAGASSTTARYVPGEALDRGGMGTILKARDRRLQRDVAMKLLAAEDGPGGAVRVRFLAEAYVTGRLDHPGIVPVHDLGLDADGRPFFTMKLVDGITFREALERVARGEEGWTVNRAVGVLSHVCNAVAYAHSKGVLHRDIKPANIMVGPFGETYLMDWGLARVLARGQLGVLPPDELAPLADEDISALVADASAPEPTGPDTWLFTQDGKVLGTPVYMSPEQARGEVQRVDERSDIWSLGAILYHLLTGRLPWVEEGDLPVPLLVLLKVRNERLTPVRTLAPDAPPTLLAICERALAQRPEDRFRSAEELAAALRDYLEDISEGREEARRQAARANHMLDFLLEMLGSAAPSEARGRDLTVREVMERAAQRVRRAPPANPLDEAHLRAMLGRLAKELGRYEDAGEHLQVAVERLEEVLGRRHPDTLSAATDLALVWRRAGRAQDAEDLLRATLEAQRESLGELHPDTLRSLDLLAALLHRVRGQAREAEELSRRALEGRRIALGERHADTLSTQSVLSSLLATYGRAEEALCLAEDALQGLIALHGADHPAVLVARSDLGRLYFRLDRFAEAERIFRATLATQEHVVGAGHPDVLTARNNLGMVLLRLGRVPEALAELTAAADGYAAATSEDHPRALDFRANVSLALLEGGQIQQAEALLRGVLLRAAAQPAVDPAHAARMRSNLGRCLRELGRAAEARDELLQARAVLAARLDAKHPWVREVEAELAALDG